MIYPLIQKNNLSGDNVTVSSVALCGDYKALATRVFDEYDIDVNGGYSVTVKRTDTRETTYIEELKRISSEKYIISVSENGAVIETATEIGAFRGLNTLCKLIKDGSLCEGTLADYPSFETRG